MKTQNGTIKKIGRSWFGRWREDAIVDGQLKRVQRFAKLAEVDDRYRSKADVRPLLADRLRALNENRADARSTLSLAAFVDEFYLPYAKESFKPSTLHGYSKLWKDSLAARVGEIRLREDNPIAGPILRSVAGKPLNLDMLANCTIVPALRDPANYSTPDAKQLTWHGYYAFRRGIATLTSSVSRDPMAAKGLLRHTSVSTTLNHYIKDVPQVTENAMTLVQELFKPVAPEEVQQ
jgi:hypothetical protein